jgi:hypothetical protein
MPALRLLPALAFVVAVACSDQTTTPGVKVASISSTLAVAPDDSTAHGRLNGTILGDRMVSASDTSSEGTWEHVAGATVEVFAEVRDSSTRSVVSSTHIGAVVSAANGTFTLTNVAKGYYRLAVTPPAGSPYKPGTAWSESLPNDQTGSAVINLFSR